MDTKSPIVNYPTPPTTSHNFSAFSFNIKNESGNYPYSPSTINNCISSSNSASPNMNMNNYNNINMYNTTSIISNNNNSTFNTPNNGQGANNTYQTSNQQSFPSYSNINYTNINPSIQPLSPKELTYVDNQGSNQQSQQNYINYNTYSSPMNSNNNNINMNDNKSNYMKRNDQKLTIDTSLKSNDDTQTNLFDYQSNNNNNIVDVKTPTGIKNYQNSNQVNTPPMTPVPEKNKKKRGDHIHYNIKTNMFTTTKQYYEISNFERTKSFDLRIVPKVDRGFFPTGPENDFTCYRRNYFQISVSFNASNAKNISEFSTPCLMKVGNEFLNVENFYIGICAKVKNGNKDIRVVQQTAKREKGPQNKPVPKLCKPGGNPNYFHGLSSNQSIVTFERLQFKSATPNVNKRSGSQQYYALVIELYADTPQKRYKVASIESKRLIVRGRSPGHYQNNGFDNINLSNSTNGSTNPSNDLSTSNKGYYDSNNNGNCNNNGVFNNGNPNNGSVQIQTNYNNNYPNDQNVNFMNSVQTTNNQSTPNNTFYSSIPYNDNRGSFDNYNSTTSSYSEDNNGVNYQNNGATTTANSFYIESPSQNNYMYQTPPLPPQQNSQSINTSIPYNVTDNQNTYSPYVQSNVSGFFPQQSQTDNYYQTNNSPQVQQSLTQNVSNAKQNPYYSSNNQDIIFTNPSASNNYIISQTTSQQSSPANTAFQPQAPSNSTTNQQPSTTVNFSSWGSNGTF
ncbi:p53-like transcription factor [Anaeromyces robustus]|uniref:p53-like transcription factor n=1 Tax=Anaeromyces robustus TaxID=1754192 RepID=A0A1Y1X1P1_9FUNG|nr:p53-like transcription factor [Anaeromyces robustus]|eukprot:ORX79693.1 p53-like transcription factor [Anaeromyces robustus]